MAVVPEVDWKRSTGAYPTEPVPKVVLDALDVEWTASTMTYPMAPTTTPIRIVAAVHDAAGHPVDFARSTGAYPMYGPGRPAPAAPPIRKAR